ncbi:hypothetical protein [Chamaesiphon sp.]|uniref:hypothetical protein n=1 Tax=Chamaesiphon sp. TaxID=2814140 RepID=UPI0035934267
MKIHHSSDRSTGNGYFCCVGVADRVADTIGGGAVTVFAEVTVAGNSTSAVAIARTSSTSVPAGDAIGYGLGVAVAIGTNPAVNGGIFGCGYQPLARPLSWLFRTRADGRQGGYYY